MKTLYFDVQCGASGDMILASLIDAGVPIDFLQKELSKLAIPDFSIDVEKVPRSAIMCSHLQLSWTEQSNHTYASDNKPDTGHHQDHRHHDHGHEHQHGHGRHSEGHLHGQTHHEPGFRNHGDILAIIRQAGYKESIVNRCEKILMRLAQAEAAVHGIPVDQVHFHEIGAIDTIVDITGISLCVDYLGAQRIAFSRLTDGKGTVTTRHGIMPVPVPAVAKLCEGYHVSILDIESELLTPTGAAALVALGEQVMSGIDGRIIATGYGCGDKQFENTPNALRVFVLESDAPGAEPACGVWSLESDMDHISGEIMGDVAGRLLTAGALDVSWCPVFMKKGRPGYKISIICSEEKKSELADLLIVHTRTLGVRMQRMERITAKRSAGEAKLLGNTIHEKYCSHKGVDFSKPEYDSLAELSIKTGKPVIELMDEYIKSKAK